MTMKVFNADERKTYILEQIKLHGKVRVAQLSQILNTSEVTIRSDLTELETDGFLERIHGGAIQSQRQYDFMDYQERLQSHIKEKVEISRLVSKLVCDGDTIAVNSGTTSYYAVRELQNKKNLKIITNSIPIATELSSAPSIEIILLGGSVNSHYSYTYGADAIAQMSNYQVAKTLISVDGINMHAGLTSLERQEAELCRLMLARARMNIVITDYTKVGRESFTRIAPISELDCLITNKNADADVLAELQGAGITVIQP